MIRALSKRGGVIGVNFYDRFLLKPGEYGHRRATLFDVLAQIRHVRDVTGDSLHVGLGTDMDGGFGAEHLPESMRTHTDLRRLGDVLADDGFEDSEVKGILAGNWLRFFHDHLPSRAQ
jgi:membrane dipeptidase